MTDAPTLADLLQRATQRALGTVSVACTARVDSYDRTSQQADVTPLVASRVEGEDGDTWVALPALRGVRVAWPSGGGFSLAWDLADGDLVTLLVRDRCHDDVDAGTVQPPVEPSSARRFSLADAVVLPGYTTDRDPLPAAAVGQDKLVVMMPNGATLRLGASTADKALALATKVNDELEKIRAAFSGHTHAVTGTCPAGGGPLSGGTAGAGPTYTRAAVDSTRAFVDG